jgi:hypothetical protein
MSLRKPRKAQGSVPELGYKTQLRNLQRKVAARKGQSASRLEAMLVEGWVQEMDLLLHNHDQEGAARRWAHLLKYGERWPKAIRNLGEEELRAVSAAMAEPQ